MEKAAFYIVGVGPGEAELMTLKAVRILNEADVVALPVTGDGKSLAKDIISDYLQGGQDKLVYLKFPMSKDEDVLEKNYQKQAEKVIDCLAQGKSVAMAVLGDAALYASGAYLKQYVQDAGYPCDVVPGVPSFCAVAARLGMSLTRKDAPLHIIPASYGIEEALGLEGTKVLMKTGKNYTRVRDALQKHNCLESAVMVQDCGLPGERIFKKLPRGEEDISYFTTIVVQGE